MRWYFKSNTFYIDYFLNERGRMNEIDFAYNLQQCFMNFLASLPLLPKGGFPK